MGPTTCTRAKSSTSIAPRGLLFPFSRRMAGDEDAPPYATGLAALRDGWRLIQASQLLPHARGEEFDLAYLKYEFFFEQWIEAR